MFVLDPKRKTLICGSVPTENLPTRKYNVLKPERRVLVRQSDKLLATGSSAVKTVKTPSLESAVKQVQDTIPSWKLECYDNLHSLPKYTVLIHSSLEFTVAVYNWPIKKNHSIYKELKRSVIYHSIRELLNIIEESSLCQSLPDDTDVMSVVVDPTSKVTVPGTVLRHSVPKP